MPDLAAPVDYMLRRMRDMPESFSVRERVNAIEAEMRKIPQLSLPLVHHFSNRLYARELYIQKDALITGKIHKYPQLNVLLKGELSVLIGDEVVRVKAPLVFVAPAGTKRIAYAHEDSIWLTAHATTETDVSKLEHDLVADSEEEYLEFCAMLKTEETKCLS